MINIDIKINDKQEICGFVVKGHANFDKYGYDIVCSAVSILVINTINSIESFTDEHFECSLKDALIDFFVPAFLIGGKNNDVSLLLNSMLLGLRALCDNYGDNVKINYVEVL